jgi:hypothetical protein
VNTACYAKKTLVFSHQIDHIISRKHGGSSAADNLALACMLCNRHKGTDVASVHADSGKIVRLFHPRRDRWDQHFQIAEEYIDPVAEVGEITVQLLRLNAPERLSERRLLQEVGAYPVR